MRRKFEGIAGGAPDGLFRILSSPVDLVGHGPEC